MTHYTGTLCLDAHEGYCECEAVYEIADIWSQGEPFAAGVDLISWTFDGRQQTRATAVALIGDGEVQRQEADACEAWLDTARRDMLDARADDRAANWIAAE